jgi:ribonucleoside-triphosphate reductase
LWSDHNSSNTISWDISEVDEIVDWLDRYWDDYVAVSWLTRNDPTKTAADLGFKYLPQEVVTVGQHTDYVRHLKPVDWSSLHGVHDVDAGECSGGVCPSR